MPSSEKAEMMLANFVIPLCLRIGGNDRGSSLIIIFIRLCKPAQFVRLTLELSSRVFGNSIKYFKCYSVRIKLIDSYWRIMRKLFRNWRYS